MDLVEHWTATQEVFPGTNRFLYIVYCSRWQLMQERLSFTFESWPCICCRKDWGFRLSVEVRTSIFMLQEDLEKMGLCWIPNYTNAFQEGMWESQSNLQTVSSDLLSFIAPEMRVPADMNASKDGVARRLCKRLSFNFELELPKIRSEVLCTEG